MLFVSVHEFNQIERKEKNLDHIHKIKNVKCEAVFAHKIHDFGFLRAK